MKKVQYVMKSVVYIGICICLIGSLAGCSMNSDAGSKEITNQKSDLANLNFNKYIKVARYKDLAFDKKKNSVSKSEIEEEISKRLAGTTKLETSSGGKVATGDRVCISYRGVVAGNVIVEEENTLYHIGKEEIFKGSEKALIGSPIGDTITKKIAVSNKDRPDQNHEVAYTFTVHYAHKAVTPQYDSTWIKNNSNYKTKKAYAKYIKKQLAKKKAKEQLWNQVLNKSKLIAIPDLDSVIYPTPTGFQEFWGYEPPSKAGKKKDSDENMKAFLILHYIAEKENLKYDDKEYDSAKNALRATGYKKGVFSKKITSKEKNYLEQKLLYEKVLDFLLENQKTKKSKDKEDLDSSTESTITEQEEKSTSREASSHQQDYNSTSAPAESSTQPVTTTSSSSSEGKDF